MEGTHPIGKLLKIQVSLGSALHINNKVEQHIKKKTYKYPLSGNLELELVSIPYIDLTHISLLLNLFY